MMLKSNSPAFNFTMPTTNTAFEKPYETSEFEYTPSKAKGSPQCKINQSFSSASTTSQSPAKEAPIRSNLAVAKATTSSKYKTELCKNVIQYNTCRYGKSCKFAHTYDELSAFTAALEAEEVARRSSKNCKSFFATKVCPHGNKCYFRHEYR